MWWLKSKPFAVRVCRLRYAPPCINQRVGSVWGQYIWEHDSDEYKHASRDRGAFFYFIFHHRGKEKLPFCFVFKEFKCKSLLLMIVVVWDFFFCNKVLIRYSTTDHCPQPNLHRNNVPCVQSYKHLTKCTFNILNKQKKQRNPGVSYCRK